MPRSPETFSTGSPGIRWISANASSVTPINVGTISATRRKTNPSIGRNRGRRAGISGAQQWRGDESSRRRRFVSDHEATSRLRGEIDVVEVVMRGGVHLVSAHFLAQR